MYAIEFFETAAFMPESGLMRAGIMISILGQLDHPKYPYTHKRNFILLKVFCGTSSRVLQGFFSGANEKIVRARQMVSKINTVNLNPANSAKVLIVHDTAGSNPADGATGFLTVYDCFKINLFHHFKE